MSSTPAYSSMTHAAPQFLPLPHGHQSEPGDGQCPHPDISSSLSSPEEELWWGWGHRAAGAGSHLVFLPASPWCRTREEVPEAPAWSGPWQCVPTEVLVPTPGGSGTSPTPQPVCPTPSISYGQGWVIFSFFYPFDPLHSDITPRGVMGRRCRRPREGALLLPPSSCPLSPSVPCPLLRSVTRDYLRTTIPHPVSSSQTPHADLSPSPIIEASLACPPPYLASHLYKNKRSEREHGVEARFLPPGCCPLHLQHGDITHGAITLPADPFPPSWPGGMASRCLSPGAAKHNLTRSMAHARRHRCSTTCLRREARRDQRV